MSTDIQRVDPGEIDIAEEVAIEALPALMRAEIDAQIATARRFPRSVSRSLREAQTLATYNEEVAAGCLYALPRDGKTIEGPSARLAEILASQWGNLRVQGRVIEETDRFIVARGECIDLEKNNARSVEVRRRIVDRRGRRYSDDMITTTANAAISIACRNAIFAVVPRAMWWPIYLAAKKVAAGSADTIETRRTRLLEYFQTNGVGAKEVFAALEVQGRSDIDLDKIGTLIGWKNAIEDHPESVDAIFRPNTPAPGSTATAKLTETIRAKKEGKPMPGKPAPEPASKTAEPAATAAQTDDGEAWAEGRE